MRKSFLTGFLIGKRSQVGKGTGVVWRINSADGFGPTPQRSRIQVTSLSRPHCRHRCGEGGARDAL
jgi:hypothetical protein